MVAFPAPGKSGQLPVSGLFCPLGCGLLEAQGFGPAGTWRPDRGCLQGCLCDPGAGCHFLLQGILPTEGRIWISFIADRFFTTTQVKITVTIQLRCGWELRVHDTSVKIGNMKKRHYFLAYCYSCKFETHTQEISLNTFLTTMHPLSWGLLRLEGWGSVKQWEARRWDPRGALGEITSFPRAGPAQHLPRPWSPSSASPARAPAHCPLHPPMAAGGSDQHGPHACSMTDPRRSGGQRGPPRDSDSTWAT